MLVLAQNDTKCHGQLQNRHWVNREDLATSIHGVMLYFNSRSNGLAFGLFNGTTEDHPQMFLSSNL